MVNVFQFSIELEPQKHLEVNYHMESAMEHIINQMNQLSFHLLQPSVNKSKNLEKDLSTVDCYKCREMGHYSR